MKKLIGTLVVLLLLAGLFYFFYYHKANKYPTSSNVLELSKTQVSEEIKELKSDRIEQSSDYGVKKACENLFAMCPECEQKWDEFLDEIVLTGQEAAGSGPYSLMHQESLISLAEQGDINGMYHQGVNLVWQGAYGFPAFRHSSNYKMPSSETIRNHEIDIKMVAAGEEYLFNSAVKGKHQAWMELQNAKSMVFRKLTKDGVDDKEILHELLAQQLAIADVVKHIYKNDSFILELYFVGMMSDIDAILNRWGDASLIEDFRQKESLLKKQAQKYSQQYFKQWQEARAYLGESVHPKEFPDSFGDFYEVAMPLCLPEH